MLETRTKLIKLPEVIEITTLSRASIYRLIADGKFPKQVKLSTRACAWVEQDVLNWLNDRINSRCSSNNQQKFIPSILSA
ncbi:MAG TPA: AlpA family transcriptional regulator [Candidatus Thioglobus autotrophicus]|jgi:prophage regulatory protein|nr:AlpA family transcriptional regulator [Thiotrichales bacterium]HIL03077.1 AlpA family transcriptional regulator [Candidatus Thioglobus autotrophicus]